ncbi:UTRA domain-containing protein, partial [Staphylococcus epidermidis]|uniref:UTRA domain-containing protein n=1 Tax=Staphylococcus epidermidis TaxID=1282 RepID=UPI0037D9E422
MLQPIKPSTNHLIIHPQIHLQPITYQPHISQLLNPSPHQPLILLKLLHYHQNHQPIFYSLNYINTTL